MILADPHIHLGAAQGGRPVKVSASRHLDLERVLLELRRYGLQLGAVVDLATTRGLWDLERLLAEGALRETADGAFVDALGTRVVGGLEAEFRVGDAGPFHLLGYAPGLDGVREIARVYREGVRAPELSTQRMHLSPQAFFEAVAAAGGVLVVAHAFTPHRGLLGVGLRPRDVLRDPSGVGVELGLSADVEIASHVGEIAGLGFLGGSDAHGPDTIGRELDELTGDVAGFSTIVRLAHGEARTIYGMQPAFGKYHRTYCLACEGVVQADAPCLSCPRDPRHRVVVGVLDRAVSLGAPEAQARYPAYRYQLPTGLLPGLGPAARARIVEAFGSVHAALHEASAEDLGAVVGPRAAQAVLDMRRGAAPSAQGGGGRWGRP